MADTYYEEAHLNLPPGVDFKEWMKVGRTLADMQNSIPFWVGDWINYGEKYGEKYSQGLALWDYGYQTLTNMAYVARCIPPEERIRGLSWTHHRHVASLDLPERTQLLEKAQQEEWTSRQLQVEVAKAKLNDTEDEEIVAWTRFTVEVSTTRGEIRRTANNINQHLVQINELFERGLIDKPAVKVLEVGTCGTQTRS